MVMGGGVRRDGDGWWGEKGWWMGGGVRRDGDGWWGEKGW